MSDRCSHKIPDSFDLRSQPLPAFDGDCKIYRYRDADTGKLPPQFVNGRPVIFVNGVWNKPEHHARSALCLSWLLMRPVIGVYNQSGIVNYTSFLGTIWGAVEDGFEAVGDMTTFNGPFSRSAAGMVRRTRHGSSATTTMQRALHRNGVQERLFKLLRLAVHRRTEIYAHSQGNLIVSNVLQAIAAVDGPAAIAGRIVHAFGSPVWTWPPGIVKREYGFTFDFVSWWDWWPSLSISKVGRPPGYLNPLTHAFELYLQNDRIFTVNKFRFGGWGLTPNMDEDGVADALIGMGTNIYRVCDVMHHMAAHHNSDSDDVAVRYVERVQKRPDVQRAVAQHRELVDLLIKVMDEGWTSDREKRAIAWLKTL